MPARGPRDPFSLHDTMRTLRRQQKRRARATGFWLLALGLAASIDLALFSGALPTKMPLASVRENLSAAAALPTFFDDAASSIYRALCPYVSDCEGTQTPSAVVAATETSRPVRQVLGAASSTASIPQSATTGPAQSATPESAPSRTIVIERIVERALPTYTIAKGGITEAILNDRLTQLDNKLSSQIFSLSASLISVPNSLPATGGVVNNIALSQRIDNLSNTTITDPVITGGSISGTSIAGTITNVIQSALATIGSLTSTELVATNATFTNATTTNLVATNATTPTTSSNLAAPGRAATRAPARTSPRAPRRSRPTRRGSGKRISPL